VYVVFVGSPEHEVLSPLLSLLRDAEKLSGKEADAEVEAKAEARVELYILVV